jgi:hypothetical protein
MAATDILGKQCTLFGAIRRVYHVPLASAVATQNVCCRLMSISLQLTQVSQFLTKNEKVKDFWL